MLSYERVMGVLVTAKQSWLVVVSKENLNDHYPPEDRVGDLIRSLTGNSI